MQNSLLFNNFMFNFSKIHPHLLFLSRIGVSSTHFTSVSSRWRLLGLETWPPRSQVHIPGGLKEFVHQLCSGANSVYMLLYTLYILMGLAFTSTIIELVRSALRTRNSTVANSGSRLFLFFSWCGQINIKRKSYISIWLRVGVERLCKVNLQLLLRPSLIQIQSHFGRIMLGGSLEAQSSLANVFCSSASFWVLNVLTCR